MDTRHGHVIDIQLSNMGSCMLDVTDVVRSGWSDCTSHSNPSDHTLREPYRGATNESFVVLEEGGAEPTQGPPLVAARKGEPGA